MKQDNQKYFTKKDGEVLRKNLMVAVGAKLETKITELKYELKDEQTKFLSKIFDLVDGLALEVKDN